MWVQKNGPHLGLGALVLIFSFCMVGFVLLTGHGLESYFNSDTLYVVDFNWDLTHRAGAVLGFQQPRMVSLIPDELIYQPLNLWLGNARLSLFIYAGLMASALIGLGAACAQRVFKGALSYHIFVFGPIYVLVCSLSLPTGAEVLLNPLMPVFHGGTFLTSLALFLVFESSLEDYRNYRAGQVLMALLCFSDPLFVFSGLIPMCLSLQMGADGRIPLTLPKGRLRGIGVAGLFGVFLTSFLFKESNPKLSPFKMFSDLPHLFWGAYGLEMSPVFLLVGLGVAVLLWRQVRRVPAHRDLAFIVLSMLVPLVVLVIFADQSATPRYVMQLIFWPLILASGWLSRQIERRFKAKAGPILVGIWLGLVAIVVGIHAGNPPVLVWRDPVDQCLEAHRQDLPTPDGLGEHWTSVRAMVSGNFSRAIEQIKPNGEPFLWGNDPYWYFHDRTRPDKPSHFSYILMAKVKPNQVVAAFGPPSRRLQCPGSEVYIYEDADSLTRLFRSRSAYVKSKLRP